MTPVPQALLDRHRAWAQCCACGLTFGGNSGFEAHRVGAIGSRRCLSLAEMRALGYAPDRNGALRLLEPQPSLFQQPEPTPGA